MVKKKAARKPRSKSGASQTAGMVRGKVAGADDSDVLRTGKSRKKSVPLRFVATVNWLARFEGEVRDARKALVKVLDQARALS